MRLMRTTALLLAAGFVVTGCSTTNSTTAATNVGNAANSRASNSRDSNSPGRRCRADLALTIHVERNDTELNNEIAYDSRRILEQLADLAEQYGVILSFELSTVFVQAVDQWEHVHRGHDCPRPRHLTTLRRQVDRRAHRSGPVDERPANVLVEAHGVTINYLSGGCSEDAGWVEAAIAAGFSAITGITEICLSLSDRALPDGMGGSTSATTRASATIHCTSASSGGCTHGLQYLHRLVDRPPTADW